MKNHLMIMLVLVLIATACGKDGMEGKTFLQFSWDPYVDSYWDDNPDTPDTIMSKTYYRVFTGLYSFEYICHDMLGNPFGIEGTYQILVNKGEDGKLFSSGKDGESKYHTLYLSKDGPDFVKKAMKIEQFQRLSFVTAVHSLAEKTYISKLTYDTAYTRGFMIVITSQKFLIKTTNQ